jgi:hypothetical protein
MDKEIQCFRQRKDKGARRILQYFSVSSSPGAKYAEIISFFPDREKQLSPTRPRIESKEQRAELDTFQESKRV